MVTTNDRGDVESGQSTLEFIVLTLGLLLVGLALAHQFGAIGSQNQDKAIRGAEAKVIDRISKDD